MTAVDLALMLIALAGVSFVVFVAALLIGDAVRTKRDTERERQRFQD